MALNSFSARSALSAATIFTRPGGRRVSSALLTISVIDGGIVPLYLDLSNGNTVAADTRLVHPACGM
jgi:hypothetical protein